MGYGRGLLRMEYLSTLAGKVYEKKIIFTESINKSIFPYNDIEWYLYVHFETKKRCLIRGFSYDQEGVKAHTSVLDIRTMTESWEFFFL